MFRIPPVTNTGFLRYLAGLSDDDARRRKLRRYGAKAREKAERAGEDLDAFDAGNEDLEIALESIESRLAGIIPSPPATSGSGSTSGTGGVSTSKTVDPVLSKRFDRTSAYGEAVDLFVAKGDGDMTEEQRFALIRAMLSSKGDGKSTGAKMELIDAVDKALANKDASNAEALKNAVEDGLKKYLDIRSKRARWKVALAEAERKIREAATDKRNKLEASGTAGGGGFEGS
eukprot:jgi/Mesvir1/25644/Mv01862-RA.1